MASHPFRALWAAFRACWIASDPSPTNQADEALVRGGEISYVVGTSDWWQLAAELAAENEDAASYAVALLGSVGLTPGRVEPRCRVRRSA